MSTPPLIVVGRTDRGRVRPRNEDSFVVDPAKGIGIVADGMGGHPGGDVASDVAARTTAEALHDLLVPLNGDAERWEEAMRESVLRAHEAIRARGRAEPSLDGMGTTTIALALDPERGRFTAVNVGDSRAYLHREGALVQLTRDDTWVQSRVDQGSLSEEEAAEHPMRHLLTQCLGLEPPPSPSVVSGEARPEDVFLLCSDGLVACLSDDEIAAVLRDHMDGTPDGAERTADALVAAANEAGGVDNITVVLLSVSPSRPDA